MAKHTIKQYFDEGGNLFIKPYLLKDLEIIFGVNKRTLSKWIGQFKNELGKKEGKRYSIRQVEILIEKFGLPRKIIAKKIHAENKQAT